MTLEQLRVLQAIISTGTFHGAAQLLNKSQPALSHTIKKLEDEIGFKILSRENYRPGLTSSGELFYRKALHVLAEANQLQELSRHLSGDHETEIHLAVTATCHLPPILETLNQIRDSFLHTHIRLSIETMGGPIEKLMEDKADFIIATMDGVIPDKVISSSYQEIRIIPVSHCNYLPALKHKKLSAAEMHDFTQIVVADSSSGTYEQSRDLLPENQKWTVSDFASKKEIIKSCMGWGGLPEHLIAEELNSGELSILDLEFFPIRISQLMLMRKRETPLGPVGKALWDKITG